MAAAARGMRRTHDGGSEVIADRTERDEVRRRGRRLWLYSQATALAITAGVVVLP